MNSSATVSVFVQRRRPHANAHDIGYHQENGSWYSGFTGQTNLRWGEDDIGGLLEGQVINGVGWLDRCDKAACGYNACAYFIHTKTYRYTHKHINTCKMHTHITHTHTHTQNQIRTYTSTYIHTDTHTHTCKMYTYTLHTHTNKRTRIHTRDTHILK